MKPKLIQIIFTKLIIVRLLVTLITCSKVSELTQGLVCHIFNLEWLGIVKESQATG